MQRACILKSSSIVEVDISQTSLNNSSSNSIMLPSIKQDLSKIILLIVLYVFQGTITGLAFGSLPFIIGKKASYAQVGVFSLATYPYSLKLLWSPIVDSVYHKKFGRRKSWIVPSQIMIAVALLLLSASVDDYVGVHGPPHVYALTVAFLFLVFLASAQDIAVDGWALTLLSKKNILFAGTCQTIGLNTGFFLSYTTLLAFNSTEFCNWLFRDAPSDQPVLTLGRYLFILCISYVIFTLWLAIAWKEQDPGGGELGIRSTYHLLYQTLKLPCVKQLCVVLLFGRIGFGAGDKLVLLKLTAKGFDPAMLSLLSLIEFPFQIWFAYLTGSSATSNSPLTPWKQAFLAKVLLGPVGGLLIVYFVKDSWTIVGCILVWMLANSFCNTVMFTCMGSFFARVSDPDIGGSYLTLLNTVSNLGSSWPSSAALFLLDPLSVQNCENTQDGRCEIIVDGVYILTIVCFVLGLITHYILQRILSRIESTESNEWRVKKDEEELL